MTWEQKMLPNLYWAGVEGALGIQADRKFLFSKFIFPEKVIRNKSIHLNDISNDSIRTSSAFVIQQDFDNKYGITNIDFVKKALKMGQDEYSGVEISLT